MDVFNSDAFTMGEMTAALNKQDFQPSLLRSLGIFTAKPIRTEFATIEERDGVLALIQTSNRGAPLGQRTTEKRKLHRIDVPRIAKGDRITASEIAGIRDFGTESELMQVQSEVARRLNGPASLMRDVELTWEHMALGAVQGIVLDADATEIINWFTVFDLVQDSEIDFDLDAASPTSGAVRKKCTQVIRQMQRAAKGAWTPMSRIVALCGDAFWDDLTAHSEVRETFLGTQEARQLREGLAYEQFNYGGITWINYQGTDDGTTVAIGSDKAKFFPINAPGVFDKIESPGEWFDVVNTPGQPVYSMVIPDEKRNAFVDLEVYSYPLFVCTRPKMLQRAKRT
jgi:hypothetical protein